MVDATPIGRFKPARLTKADQVKEDMLSKLEKLMRQYVACLLFCMAADVYATETAM